MNTVMAELKLAQLLRCYSSAGSKRGCGHLNFEPGLPDTLPNKRVHRISDQGIEHTPRMHINRVIFNLEFCGQNTLCIDRCEAHSFSSEASSGAPGRLLLGSIGEL